MAPDQAPWASAQTLRDHFHQHGEVLGRSTLEGYDLSARAAFRVGKRFTFTDTKSGRKRVGYYDARNERLTVLTEQEIRIVTHFHCEETYVRHRPDSDYRR